MIANKEDEIIDSVARDLHEMHVKFLMKKKGISRIEAERILENEKKKVHESFQRFKNRK